MSHHIQIYRILLNCFLVPSYLKILRHALVGMRIFHLILFMICLRSICFQVSDVLLGAGNPFPLYICMYTHKNMYMSAFMYAAKSACIFRSLCNPIRSPSLVTPLSVFLCRFLSLCLLVTRSLSLSPCLSYRSKKLHLRVSLFLFLSLARSLSLYTRRVG